MANIIKLKQSSVAGKVPISGDLIQGELAVNTNDEKLYTKNSSGTIVELGGASTNVFTNSATAPTSPTLGDTWYDPSTLVMSTRAKDTNNVPFWWAHTLLGSTASTLDGGTSQTYTYDASEIYEGGDAASTYTTELNGGTA
jgi:hypothetical protein